MKEEQPLEASSSLGAGVPWREGFLQAFATASTLCLEPWLLQLTAQQPGLVGRFQARCMQAQQARGPLAGLHAGTTCLDAASTAALG